MQKRSFLFTLLIMASWLLAVAPVMAQGFIPVEELKPLDDPNNPYAGQYAEWDIWAHEHFRPGMDAKAITADLTGEVPDAPRVLTVAFLQLAADAAGNLHLWTYQKVDGNGYLVPAATPHKEVDSQNYAFASGPIERTVYDAWVLQVNAAVAIGYPPIPAFIGEHAPLSVVMVPNGEFAVKGPLGLGDTENFDMQASSRMASRERWYRYSAEGELLGQTGVVGRGWHDNSWMLLYCPELTAKLEEMRGQGLDPSFRYGTVSFVPSTSRTYSNEADALWDQGKPFPTKTAEDVVECYDYNGQPFDVNQAWSDGGDIRKRARQLDAPIVRAYYLAQLSVGHTSAEPSPFMGRANGPFIANADYRPPVAAYPRSGGQYDFTEKPVVRDLDAPGNPYAGQYSEWDRLCFEHAGEFAPARLEKLNTQRNAMNQLVEDAKQAGKTLEQFRQENPELATGFVSENFSDDGVVTLFCHVDANGYLIPMSRTRMWPGSRSASDQVTDWVISASLQFDAETMQRFEAWKAGLEQ